MKAYAVIILITIAAQLIGKCFGGKFDDSIRENARDKVEIKWQEEIQHPGAMDGLQTKFECCGRNSHDDYIDVLHRAEIPSSCYYHTNNGTMPFEEGCLIVVEKKVVKAFTESEKGGWISIMLMAILFGFALYLTINFMNKKRRNNYKN